MTLADHYAAMWQEALPKLASNSLATDPLLDDPNDHRLGLTLVIRPTAEVKHRMAEFVEQLRRLEPEQYYYPPSDMHVTLLTLISCYEGFALSQINPSAYKQLLASVLPVAQPFTINFAGITASAATVMVQGFPRSAALQELRGNLRTAFRASALPQTIDKRYVLQTAHSTVARFRAPLREPLRFVELLQQYRQHAFGTMQVQHAELVCNDWYHRARVVQCLGRFALG
ncbi:mutarotase [Hymenobacter oligotrophus]|uniref:Mutarotase n=1 Tax=Hymenobacter oligotrophus TaxID=2319843 RepID=A0A3B7RDF2_9BACT|nr:mutarotase [Hymenobacter oligotrophus]AYA37276.1 mutarotase [Hymenobacter oligotrophus]